MTLLNADFTLLFSIPWGIIIALVVVLFEIYLLQKYLKLNDGTKITFAVSISNLSSFIFGIFLFDHPLSQSMSLISLLIACAIVSILIESFVNGLFLYKYGVLKIFIGTTIINVISNLFAGMFIYQYLHEFLHIPRWQ